MQREAAGERVKRRAVEVVARDRAADVRQVHADLVRAPGLQPQPKERPVPGDALHAVVRDGMLAILPHGAPGARAQPRDGRVDGSLRRFGDAFGDRQVFAEEAAGVQLAGQQALGVRMPRDAQQAAGALVQPVDRVIDERLRIGVQQAHHLLAQRAGGDVPGGERGQRRALAHDQQVLILIAQKGRRQAGCSGLVRIALLRHVAGQVHLDDLARAQPVIRAHGHAADADGAEHLQPSEGVLPQRKAPGDDAAHRAAGVRLGDSIGQNAHGQPPFDRICLHYSTECGQLTKLPQNGTIQSSPNDGNEGRR